MPHLLPESNKETIFTDVLSIPFFLVSARIKQVIQMYDSSIILKELVLLDKTNERAERYFIPIFDELECLHEDSEFNMDRSKINFSYHDKILGILLILRSASIKKYFMLFLQTDILKSSSPYICQTLPENHS